MSIGATKMSRKNSLKHHNIRTFTCGKSCFETPARVEHPEHGRLEVVTHLQIDIGQVRLIAEATLKKRTTWFRIQIPDCTQT